jgi:hypothetical protein
MSPQISEFENKFRSALVRAKGLDGHNGYSQNMGEAYTHSFSSDVFSPTLGPMGACLLAIGLPLLKQRYYGTSMKMVFSFLDTPFIHVSIV